MTYKHGLPFSEILLSQLQDLKTRVDLKKASLIIVDGGVGEGKTTLAVHVADTINNLYGQKPIEMDGPQLAMGGVDFLKKLRNCFEDDLPVIIYDEAGDFNRRGALGRLNAMLNRTFETFRAFRCIVIIVLPSFHVLDTYLFDNRIPRMLIHCEGRTQSQGNFKVFDLLSMLWLKHWIDKLPLKHYAYNRVYPNIWGHFQDLPPDRSKELDRVSTKNKIEILRKSEIKAEGLVTYSDIGTKLARSVSWCRTTINKLKIKPKRTIKGTKYFDQDAINRLAEYIDQTPQGRPRKK